MKNPSQTFGSKPEQDSKRDEMLTDKPDEVAVLDNTNFEDFVDSNEKVIVMFYAPWCGVCKAAKPSYFEAAELLADEDEDTKFAVFNCDSDDPADQLYSAQFGVTGYPTVYYFAEGEQKYKFGGFHNVDAFLRFGRDPKGKGKVALKSTITPIRSRDESQRRRSCPWWLGQSNGSRECSRSNY